MPEYHSTVDCLINCEILPKIAAHRDHYDLAGIVNDLALNEMILSLVFADTGKEAWAFRNTCDQDGCPCPLDGTDEGVEKMLWTVINGRDLTSAMTAEEVKKAAEGARGAAEAAASGD